MDSNNSLQVLNFDELQLAAGGSVYTDMGQFYGSAARSAWNGIRDGYQYVEMRFLDWVME